ncbi:hypothetical protein VaNZ11_007405 [Volvox africanus]|uniref:F-box domain-containing protein n=1 Tax=Volvox africanus TaxID=51714 RepID=A0ABQ5S2T6_9CHLO|nr:hypothetical protein VaNZ11_007405 [Volvox africanus]
MSSIGLALLLANPQEDYTFLLRQVPTPSLPEEVLVVVMLHLDLHDVLACRLVNKSWSRAATSGVRHLDVPCKALAATVGADRVERADAMLRRMQQVWSATEAVTLSGLAAGWALKEELSLQLLMNHLSCWRNLREVHLRGMPVFPVATLPLPRRLAPPHRLGRPAPPVYVHSGRADGAEAAVRSGVATVTATTSSDPSGVARSQNTSRDMRVRRADAGTSVCGDGGYNGSSTPGPWRLECLSCCLGLTRLEVELVPVKQQLSPTSPAQFHGQHSLGCCQAAARACGLADSQSQQQQTIRQADVAQLVAGQAALLEGLTRLTRLTHLSIRLLDLPAQSIAGRGAVAAEDSESEQESEIADLDEGGDEDEDNSASEYVHDIDDAGIDYASDLEMDLELGQDLVLNSDREDGNAPAVDGVKSYRFAGNIAMGSTSGGFTSNTLIPPQDGMNGCMVAADADSGVGQHEASRRNPQLHDTQTLAQPTSQSSDGSDSQGYGSSEDADGYKRSSDGDDVLGNGGSWDAAAGLAAARPASRRRRLGPTVMESPMGNWIPHPAVFVRMFSRLRSLRLTGCNLCGGGALASFANTLTCLTSLSLQGRLGVSHKDLAALSGLKDLHDLTLSKVDLLYDPRDPDDCPVALMAELYCALQQLRNFQSLSFDVDPGGSSSGIHSAYLLPLYDSPIPRLRSLSLSMILDSDYSFHMLAELTSLTALNLSYVTWPLALQSDDMTLLAPLTGLRRFSMQADPSERHHLISLSGRVVYELAKAWTDLSQLAFRGQIRADIPGGPSLEFLASWTSLRDLSLSAVLDEDDTDCRLVYTNNNNNGNRGHGDRFTRDPTCASGGLVGAGAAAEILSFFYNDDDDNSKAAQDAGALDLGVGLARCLPPGLTRLALSGLRLGGTELLQLLSGSLKGLTSLQVLDCGLTPAHFMVGDCAASQLQVLVLNDSHPWRACSSRGHEPKDWEGPRGYTATAVAVTRLPHQYPGSTSRCDHSTGPSCLTCCPPGAQPLFLNRTSRVYSCGSCCCCCLPNIWTSWNCFGGPQTQIAYAPHPLNTPPSGANSGKMAGVAASVQCKPSGRPTGGQIVQQSQWKAQERLRVRQVLPQCQQRHLAYCSCMGVSCSAEGVANGDLKKSDNDSLGRETADRRNEGKPVRFTCLTAYDDWSYADGGSVAELEHEGGCGGLGERTCSCWRQCLIRHGLRSLGALRKLEFLLLGFPVDELAAMDVLRPLAVLTGLRCLTVHACGLQATEAREVSEQLGRLAQVRSLHLAGPRADSAAAQGVIDAARRLPYL